MSNNRTNVALMISMIMMLANIGFSQPSTLPLQTPPPAASIVVSTSIVGRQNFQVYYYWVVVNYPIGSSVAFGPAVITTAPSPLTAANFVRVSWNAIAGATSYTVLRNTINSVPIGGSVSTVAAGTTATSAINDNTALGAYSAGVTVASASGNITLNNRDYSVARITTTPGFNPSELGVPNGASLPAICQIGDFFTLTSAGVGAKLYSCVTVNTWEQQSGGGGGGGTVSIQNNGTLVGTRSTLNWTTGLGITNALSDTGTVIQFQQNVDTAVIQSRANTQSGQTLYCGSTSASTTTYTCSMLPALTAYTTGMAINWQPDVASVAGAVTLNINTLGNKSVLKADGISNPGSGDVTAGQLIPIWYDGTAFRLPNSGGGATVIKDGPYLSIASIPYLMPGMLAVTKPNAATWAASASGGTLTTLDGGAMALTTAAGTGNAWSIRHTARGAFTTATFAAQCLGQADGTGQARCAIILRENASARLMVVELARQEVSAAITMRADCWTNPTTYGGVGLFNGATSALSNNLAYLRLVYSAGNVLFQVSHTGLVNSWTQMGTWSQTACGMGGAPDQIGIATYANNAVGTADTMLTLLSFKLE